MNNLSIIIIVGFVILSIALICFKLYGHIKLKGLRQTAIDLICEAEKAYEKGKNCEKFTLVVDGLLDILPATAKIFINKHTIEMFVQTVFDSIKIALDTNN